MLQNNPVRSDLNEKLRIGQVQYRLLYSNLPTLIYALDRENRLVGVNDRWLTALQYSRTEVLGRPATEFLTSETRHNLQMHYLPALRASGRIDAVSCDLLKKSGDVLPALLTAFGEFGEDTDDDLARLLAVLTRPDEHALAQSVADALAPAIMRRRKGDVMADLVSSVAGAFHARYAFVTECVNRAMTRVRTLAFVDGDELLENVEYDLAGTPCEGVIHGSGCYYPEQLGALFATELDKDSYLGIPLYDSHGTIMGHLAVLDDHPMQVEPHNLALLEVFATRAAAELERKHALEAQRFNTEDLSQLNQQLEAYNRDLAQMVAERTLEIERRRQVAETMRDLMMILNTNRPLEEILDYIVSLATQLLGTESGAIYGLQLDQSKPVMQAARGLPATYNNVSFALEHGFISQAVVNRQPVVVSNLACAVMAADKELTRSEQKLLAEHFRTLLMVPLLRPGLNGAADAVFGGIALYFQQQRQFSDEEISLAVAFGAQAALAIENARLRQLSEQAAIIAERNRLARDLHDSVTQSLYSLTLMAEGWRRMASAGTLPAVEPALAELGELGRQALKEMRLLLYELRPPALDKVGLLGALHQRLAAVEKRAGVDARLIADAIVELPPAVETGLYHIAQEALNNILKHAAATTVIVSLCSRSDHIWLEISDNGCGFDPAQDSTTCGIGLASMSERTMQLGGVLTLDTAPNAGCKICVSVPL